ncbi:spore gernimation protein GerPD [Bacillus fonticola]|uniref:spore gernimation protein GerPD n=1 Tax=Bacillus fonticola TaxID=2728853 RepID=UPI001475E97F|nr:spore gernimation protein GerPD [Bacillus fonticola]
MIEWNVTNGEFDIESIDFGGVASSAIVILGDCHTIQAASTFDTPAESLIIGPFVPFAPRG